MKIFVTGATGFVGGRLTQRLRERGDDVITLARSEAKAGRLRAAGCEVAIGTVNDAPVIREAATGCDVVVHLAAEFRIGVPMRERPSMHRTNVEGTATVLDSAHEAGVGRVVYASTVNVFGDTHGAVVDETYERDLSNGFLSYYDETKYQAHVVAQERVARGQPIVMVQPGVIYGPGDHFETGKQIIAAAKGKLPVTMLADTGVVMTYIEDVVDGVVAAIDKGVIGESYVLGGEIVRLKEVFEIAAGLTGARRPFFGLPTPVMWALAPFGPVLGPRLGYAPNFYEWIRAGSGTTYWATDAKARAALEYSPTPLESGIKTTLEAAGVTVN